MGDEGQKACADSAGATNRVMTAEKSRNGTKEKVKEGKTA